MSRFDDLVRFYDLLGRLERKLGGRRRLADCNGRMGWPARGVYFFFEDGEERRESGHGLRVIRVGTHALTAGSKSTLWGRLSQHRGHAAGGHGNHRGSIFRLLVGTSIKAARASEEPRTWGIGSDPGKAAERFGLTREAVKQSELEMEESVSKVIGRMPFLWLDVSDTPGQDSLRGRIERNAIALLSNLKKPVLDPASSNWLGCHCDREKVRMSGLWNNNYVDEAYDRQCISCMEDLIDK
jgi:hypothetical protein